MRTWKDVRPELFTAEEIRESDSRVALIGELIKARQEKNISQRELEQLSGVKQPIISRMEAGETSPQLDTVLRVLAPLGKTLSILPTILPSKDFENMLSMDSLCKLEAYSTRCHEFFDNTTEDIKLSEIQAKFPAFVFNEGNRNVLYIKHPTYKIAVFDEKFSFSYSGLENLIEKSGYAAKDYLMYIQPNTVIVIGGHHVKKELPCITEILCLRNSLSDNEILANEISSILKENSISYDIWPSYYLMPKNIKVKLIDDERYVEVVR